MKVKSLHTYNKNGAKTDRINLVGNPRYKQKFITRKQMFWSRNRWLEYIWSKSFVFQLTLVSWPSLAWWQSWWQSTFLVDGPSSGERRIDLVFKEFYFSVLICLGDLWNIDARGFPLFHLTWKFLMVQKWLHREHPSNMLNSKSTSHYFLGEKIIFMSNHRHTERPGGKAGEWHFGI